MISRGFAFIVAIIFIAAIVSIGGGSYLILNQGAESVQNGGTAREEILFDTERQLEMAAKSGGITQESYDLLALRLTELEAQGVERAIIVSLRAKLEALSIGERAGSTSVQPSQAEPIKPAPAKAKTVAVQSAVTQTQTDAQLLASIVERTKLAVQSGGITWEAYDQIDKQLATLESRGINTTSARTEFAKLIVSGRPVTCVSNRNPVFTHHITDIRKIDYVVPPPTMGAGPSLKPHSYIGTNKARAPVYAPVDMVLETGAYYDIGPYWLGFRISCEVKLRFVHITDPIDQIKAVFPSVVQSGTAERPNAASVDQQIKKEIPFKAGDLIGYTETGNWDFGVYDLASNNRYLGDPDWGDSWVYTSAVCPFDYFPADMREAYTSKFDTTILAGNPPHGESFCVKYFE